MLLQFRKNPIADYQQVTNDEILPDFQNNFPSLDFIARKLRLQKSKCKENSEKSDKETKRRVIFSFKQELPVIAHKTTKRYF